MNTRNNWTREEHILTFSLYSQIPFGTIHIHNPKILELAKLLGRSVGSVSLKLANFSRLDPALHARGIRGMAHGAKGEEKVWEEFATNPEALAFESQRLMAERLKQNIVEYTGIETNDLPITGSEREAVVRLRVNQNFFRKRVLSAYNYQCCITGLAIPELLIASHIVPWAEDVQNRLNPRNGLCLNAFHDRAFDQGLIWIESDFTISLSPRLLKRTKHSAQTVDWFMCFAGRPLLLPRDFQPDPALLAKHAARWGRDR